jgi:hypothetical protein
MDWRTLCLSLYDQKLYSVFIAQYALAQQIVCNFVKGLLSCYLIYII